MRYALVDGRAQEAKPHLRGTCRFCERLVVPKCGERRVWHWAHQRGHFCDEWWEKETEWHRDWKGQFPPEWQEYIQHSSSGERHIADVKTDDGWVLEFQHSPINPEERRTRDAFYCPKLVWVVNGLRRKTDLVQFERAWQESRPINPKVPSMRILFAHDVRLLREWVGSDAQVFIDFGAERGLWWLLSSSQNGSVYVVRLSRAEFIEVHRCTSTQKAHDFDSLVRQAKKFLDKFDSRRHTQALIIHTANFGRRTAGRRRFRL
jgi:hypothetical protein